MGELDRIAEQKRAAAEAAVALIQDGMRVGLGTGSTVFFAVEALARRIRNEGLRLRCIATSTRTENQATRLGIPLATFAEISELDLTIDGADEVQEHTLNLIKGLGGALLREKIVAFNSRRFIVIADSSKLVTCLGDRAPVPVEVERFGHEATARRLRALGCQPKLRAFTNNSEFVTDGGNFIYDCSGFAPIDNPVTLDSTLFSIVGVIETGLFPSMVSEVLLADTVVTQLRPAKIT